jgi:hypothetical protein
MDELIAWTHIQISQAVLKGETHEDWFVLSGKQGEGQEGMINPVLSYSVSEVVYRVGILHVYLQQMFVLSNFLCFRVAVKCHFICPPIITVLTPT